MGQLLARALGPLLGKHDYRILLVGLDNAGKTTILYKLRLGEMLRTVPTIGFNVEQVEYKNISFTMWDVGGQDKIRPLWKHYFQGSHAVIYVVDSADAARMDEARDELAYMLKSAELDDAAVLVLANKQDLPGALTAAEITGRLDLPKNRRWFVQSCCAVTAAGLYEGLDWLSRTLKAGPKARVHA